MSEKSVGVAILGGTGYGAGELMRLFVSHPNVEVVSVVSSSQSGTPVCSAHSHLAGFYSLNFSSELGFEALSRFKHAVVFASLPHGTSSQEIAKIVERAKNLKIIDLSGDLRLRSESDHSKFYGDVPFAPELRKRFVYGLPELHREEIKRAQYISNPGCLASAASLAAMPLSKAGLIESLVFDAKTGASGAGKTPQASMHHPTRHGNFEAYKVLSHRHEAEIVQTLTEAGSKEISTMFVPHLIPASRGIFVTAYATLNRPVSDVTALFKNYYSGHPFIRFRADSPNLQDVIGTNFCDIGIKVRGNQVVVMTALDNLVKGMTGVAIQNMNLMCGIDETTGLFAPSLGTI